RTDASVPHSSFCMTSAPPLSPRFPYTTLFRSLLDLLGERLTDAAEADVAERVQLRALDGELALLRVGALGDHDDRRVAGLEPGRSEEHTSELQSRENLVCRLRLEKNKRRCAPI